MQRHQSAAHRCNATKATSRCHHCNATKATRTADLLRDTAV